MHGDDFWTDPEGITDGYWPRGHLRRQTMTGTIKRIVRDKGFGFIREDDGPTEYFFHRSNLARGVDFDSLTEGEKVWFDEEEGTKGPRAGSVERV